MVRGSVDDGVGLLLLGNFCSLPTLKNHPQSQINTGQNGSVGCPPLKETLARFLGTRQITLPSISSNFLSSFLQKHSAFSLALLLKLVLTLYRSFRPVTTCGTSSINSLTSRRTGQYCSFSMLLRVSNVFTCQCFMSCSCFSFMRDTIILSRCIFHLLIG